MQMQPEDLKSNPGMEPWRPACFSWPRGMLWPTHSCTRAQRHSRVGRTLCRPGLASQDGFHRLPSDVAAKGRQASWPCPDGDETSYFKNMCFYEHGFRSIMYIYICVCRHVCVCVYYIYIYLDYACMRVCIYIYIYLYVYIYICVFICIYIYM